MSKLKKYEEKIASQAPVPLENIQSAESAKSAVAQQFSIETAPRVPDSVYNQLPDLLRVRCLLIDGHRRDIFLISALPVLAAQMPNVLAQNVDAFYSPDLFTLIVGEPGSGKGISSDAKGLGHVLNETIIQQSKQAIADFEALEDEDKTGKERPKEKSLLIPANSSSRAIYDTIQSNEGSGLMFENEIDTLLNATKQEWGNFSDVVRKSFHHESISINRKNERYFIDSPRLSICLSGTFDQFKKMFGSAENGHFSRYGMYTFEVDRKWRSHRPTSNSRAFTDSIESGSQRLYKMYKLLINRNEPLYINLTGEQWQRIDDKFAKKMQFIENFDLSKHLHASNNRAAIIALRIASIVTVLRVNDNNANLLVDETSLTPT
jgi:hypothetical protein